MKTKLSTLSIVLAVGLVLGLAWTAAAQGGEPLTLNINLGGEPLTLDPALAGDTTSITVIEQLFIGLVDLDDDSAEVRPELATSWTVSPDGTVYTFTLRSDVYWTDGRPVTAGDVRYGILRTLNPATRSDYAIVLYIIKNAEAYHTGAITDPNQVGVTALDDAHLRITLEYPASYALSILSMWVARPMPQWAIEAWGNAWTEPGHIVTNGAYRLTAWVHNDHILLDKNPTYYDATNVQIERVKMWMVNEGTAWTMYLNGQLDTASMPPGHAHEVLPQEVHIQPIPCTSYFGFSVSQAPFDNPLVRKAFAAATDRQGLVNTLFGGIPRPALTFAPPGVFGYVDGYAEGVGIPYNPTQARQWLAQAGYPNGQGLPPITLWSSTGGQYTARYIRDNWYTTLGVSVTLQSLPWGDYLAQLDNGQFQIWRLVWCMDYPDANNFLYDAIELHRGAHGNWRNAEYDHLVSQAVREQNPDTRRSLYKQAEEILVETDAVVIPMYYSTSVLAVKPYLERTYGAGGSIDIATWRITRVSGEIGTDGGGLTSYHGDTTIQIPAGAIMDTIVITHTPAYILPPGGNLTGIGHEFDVTAVYSSTGQPAQIAPGQTYTLTVHYTDAERGPAREDTLALYYWDGSQWVKEPGSVVDTAANTVTAHPNHFSRWAVLGETRRMHLPLVLRNYR
jgi:oligopeptide transport system substrate-binding protein